MHSVASTDVLVISFVITTLMMKIFSRPVRYLPIGILFGLAYGPEGLGLPFGLIGYSTALLLFIIAVRVSARDKAAFIRDGMQAYGLEKGGFIRKYAVIRYIHTTDGRGKSLGRDMDIRCRIFTDCTSKSLDYLEFLFKLAKEDFPDLERGDIQIERHNDALGIWFYYSTDKVPPTYALVEE